MEKMIVVKREYKYLFFLIGFGLFIILFSEGTLIYYDSIAMDEFAKSNNLYEPYSFSDRSQFFEFKRGIEKSYIVIRSFIMVLLFPFYIIWYKKAKKDITKIVLLISIIVTVLIIVSIIANSFHFATNLIERHRWELRVFYLIMCIPFILVYYERGIIGVRVVERIHKKKEIEINSKTYQSKLLSALENDILTKEEYNSKILEHQELFLEKIILTDKEFLGFKERLGKALIDKVISKQEHEVKLTSFREKRLEELVKITKR